MNNMRAVKLLRAGLSNQKILIHNGATIESQILLIGAGTINTTCLVADYFGLHGTELKILSNPCAASAFLFPRLIGKVPTSKSFALGQLAYKNSLANNEYITGVFYGADALPHEFFSKKMPFLTRPVANLLSSSLAPALILATSYLKSDHSNNILTIKKPYSLNDDFEISITGKLSTDAQSLIRLNNSVLKKQLKRLGCFYIPGSLKIAPPGADAHLGGTIPMGGTGILRCNEYGKVNNAGNIFIIDGAALPSMPAKHPTLTIMANANRIGEFLSQK